MDFQPIIISLLLAFPALSQAQPQGAIEEYLRPIVSKIAADPNVGGWSWENHGNGGYLLRMFMDVTGDGRPELLITTSLTAFRHWAEWAVIDVSETGKMRLYDSLVRGSWGDMWPLTEGTSTSLLYQAPPSDRREMLNEEKTIPLCRYSFAFPKITETLEYADEDEVTKLRPQDPRWLPALQAILLVDYLTSPGARWSDVSKWKYDASDYFYRDEDFERALKNTDFTAKVALARLGLAKNDDSKSENRPTNIPQSNKVLKSATRNEAPGETSPSKPLWGVGVVMAAAAAGLLWLFLKKKKP